MPKASGLAAEIKQALDVDTELVVGSRGAFDVVANGELIFSKQQEHRFPEPEEIIGALRSLGSPAA